MRIIGLFSKTSVHSVLHEPWSVPLLVSSAKANQRPLCIPHRRQIADATCRGKVPVLTVEDEGPTSYRKRSTADVQHSLVHHVNSTQASASTFSSRAAVKCLSPNVGQVDRRVDLARSPRIVQVTKALWVQEQEAT